MLCLVVAATGCTFLSKDGKQVACCAADESRLADCTFISNVSAETNWGDNTATGAVVASAASAIELTNKLRNKAAKAGANVLVIDNRQLNHGDELYQIANGRAFSCPN